MRLSKSIKIDDKEYTVRELTVEEIIKLFSTTEPDDGNQSQKKKEEKRLVSLVGQVFGGHSYMTRFLEIAMPGTKIEALLKLAPSELAQIWNVLKEVNSHFFEMAQKLELGEQMILALKEILTDFSRLAVALSREAMEEEFSNTGTLTSSKP